MIKFSKKRSTIRGVLLLSLIVPTLVIWIEIQPYLIIKLNADELTMYHGNNDTVVVYPIFTQGAYTKHGFYAFYNKTCNESCLTIQIPTKINPNFNTGKYAYLYLKQLGYPVITDVDVDKNPSILDKYQKIILLHNEYVTQNEFDAITSHNHVIYLYPNALYAKIKVNYKNNTMTLIRGHNYPETSIRNGFGWQFDNSAHEYDLMCNNWHFANVSNGFQLNCYPDLLIAHDHKILGTIQKL